MGPGLRFGLDNGGVSVSLAVSVVLVRPRPSLHTSLPFAIDVRKCHKGAAEDSQVGQRE
jgi:hypothetical protein